MGSMGDRDVLPCWSFAIPEEVGDYEITLPSPINAYPQLITVYETAALMSNELLDPQALGGAPVIVQMPVPDASSIVDDDITSDNQKPYGCKNCQRAYATKSNLARHIRKKHNATKKKRQQCTICSKKFWSPSDVKNHMKSHSNAKDHECKICFKRFKFRSGLYRHMRSAQGHPPSVEA